MNPMDPRDPMNPMHRPLYQQPPSTHNPVDPFRPLNLDPSGTHLLYPPVTQSTPSSPYNDRVLSNDRNDTVKPYDTILPPTGIYPSVDH